MEHFSFYPSMLTPKPLWSCLRYRLVISCKSSLIGRQLSGTLLLTATHFSIRMLLVELEYVLDTESRCNPDAIPAIPMQSLPIPMQSLPNLSYSKYDSPPNHQYTADKKQNTKNLNTYRGRLLGSSFRFFFSYCCSFFFTY